MSNKLGNQKPLYTIRLRCDWGSKPPQKVTDQWARLDHYAQQDHRKMYDKLTDAQKLQIHYNLNAGVYRAQEKQESKDSSK